MNNMILLKHLMEIASTKRVDDGVRVRSASSNAGRRKNIDWRDFLEQILNMRRQQLEKLKAELEAELARERGPSQVIFQISGFQPTKQSKIQFGKPHIRTKIYVL